MSTKYDADEDVKPQKNGAVFPAVVNAVLFLFALGFLGGARSYYQNKIDTVALDESLFITTEWHILQEMKAQTDQQLSEKDREIAALRRRYRELSLGSSDPAELRRLEEQLAQAREEREEIASRRFDAGKEAAPEEPEAASAGTAEEPLPAEPLPEVLQRLSLSELLRKEIENLEIRLVESEAHNTLLREELTLIRAAYQNTAAENHRISGAARELQGAVEALNHAREALERRRDEAEAPAPVRLEDLQTQTLLKAIAGAPEIKALYPALSEQLNGYLRVFALRQRLEGRREAYAEALEVLKPLRDGLGIE